MNTPAKASLPVIKRLPKYYRYLRSLQADGITSISSRELAAQMGTTASQVRQDFNCIGDVNGRQGIGYSVENLLSILESLLFGNGDRLPTILIGCGRLGKAVSRFITTDANGYKLIAAFDVAQNEVGKEINGIQIRHVDELEVFCAEHHPKVAVLCVPRDGAEQVVRVLDVGDPVAHRLVHGVLEGGAARLDGLAIITVKQTAHHAALLFFRDVVGLRRFTRGGAKRGFLLTRPGQRALNKHIGTVANPGNDARVARGRQFQRIERVVHRPGQARRAVYQRTVEIESDSADFLQLIHEKPLPARYAYR